MGYLTELGEPDWFPYFGNQRRVTAFVLEALRELDLPQDAVIAETNSGTHSVSSAIRAAFPLCTTIGNDLSLYSVAIGRALLGQSDWRSPENKGFLASRHPGSFSEAIDRLASEASTPAEAAAIGALLVELGGYDLDLANHTDWLPEIAERLRYWHDQFAVHAVPGKGRVTNMDLFDFLDNFQGDVVYMNFAWPWRDGRDVTEYGVMADTVTGVLSQEPFALELWTAANVMEKVKRAVTLAAKRFRYVILSNQSSNYPTADVLEPELDRMGLRFIAMRQLTLPAIHTDNRGLDKWFTQYQYILSAT